MEANRLSATIKFLTLLVWTSFRASMALRSAFFMQVVFMLINNMIFFTIWWILFQKFDEINGWTIVDVKTLYGFAAGGWGVAVVFGCGARFIADKIISGDLDSYLVQPKNSLLHLVGSQSAASGWGDILSGFILFAWAGNLTLQKFPAIAVLVCCSALIYLSVITIANCAVFWLGNIEGFQHQLYEFLILFSTYPGGLFGGMTKVLLFSVVPAGFVSYLPAEVMRDLNGVKLLICVGAALAYMLLAMAIFKWGLRRYESGNLLIAGKV